MITIMNTNRQTKQRRGVTLIELTVVIVFIGALVGLSVASVNGYKEWEQGIDAGEDLRKVYAAQRLYLSDFPTTNIADLVVEDLIPYLPNGGAALPIVNDLDGNPLNINITASPPVFENAGGAAYDPTGANDGQWDVGR